MANKRVMFFGAAGQVGQAFSHTPKPQDWDIIACDHKTCDMTNVHQLRELVQHTKPHLVINAAAMTAVDVCETEHDKARAVNFEAVANLAAQCSMLDAPLIHLSTDYVFDGRDHTTPYKPEDAMNPLSAYGETKMMGEEAIRHELPWHVILRVSSVFSAYGTNLLTKALRAIDEKDTIHSVTDQVSCPTHAPAITEALVVMGEAILNGKTDGFGTFHLCGEGAVTRLEFMQGIMDAYAAYTTRRPALLPAKSSDFPGFAERPAYSVLDCSKTEAIYGIRQQSWRTGITSAITTLMHNKGIAA